MQGEFFMTSFDYDLAKELTKENKGLIKNLKASLRDLSLNKSKFREFVYGIDINSTTQTRLIKIASDKNVDYEISESIKQILFINSFFNKQFSNFNSLSNNFHPTVNNLPTITSIFSIPNGKYNELIDIEGMNQLQKASIIAKICENVNSFNYYCKEVELILLSVKKPYAISTYSMGSLGNAFRVLFFNNDSFFIKVMCKIYENYSSGFGLGCAIDWDIIPPNLVESFINEIGVTKFVNNFAKEDPNNISKTRFFDSCHFISTISRHISDGLSEKIYNEIKARPKESFDSNIFVLAVFLEKDTKKLQNYNLIPVLPFDKFNKNLIPSNDYEGRHYMQMIETFLKYSCIEKNIMYDNNKDNSFYFEDIIIFTDNDTVRIENIYKNIINNLPLKIKLNFLTDFLYSTLKNLMTSDELVKLKINQFFNSNSSFSFEAPFKRKTGCASMTKDFFRNYGLKPMFNLIKLDKTFTLTKEEKSKLMDISSNQVAFKNNLNKINKLYRDTNGYLNDTTDTILEFGNLLIELINRDSLELSKKDMYLCGDEKYRIQMIINELQQNNWKIPQNELFECFTHDKVESGEFQLFKNLILYSNCEVVEEIISRTYQINKTINPLNIEIERE